MHSTLFKLRLNGLLLFIRPLKEFEKLFQEAQNSRLRLLQVFLGGIVLLQYYADLFNLGDTYPVGKIMSASLIVGPVAGTLVALFAALFIMNLGCLFDKGHRPVHTQLNWAPPLPLRFIWNRIFGPKKINSAFQSGILRPYAKAWNFLVNGFARVAREIGFGRTPFASLFKATVRSMALLVVAAGIQLMEHIFLDDTTFSGDHSGLGTIAFAAKTLLVAGTFASWAPMAKTAFQISWPKAILVAAISTILSISLVLLTMNTIFALPLR